MTVSFVITTHNVQACVGRCLQSVAEVATDGDQIIVIDDGSGDGTVDVIQHFVTDKGFGPGVEIRSLSLGTNTFGGIGVSANIGLEEADREAIFFVSGRNWVNPDGFRRARAYWTLNPADILFTNYLEFDQQADRNLNPADSELWNNAFSFLPLEESRSIGLEMAAHPWRKLYRRDFLVRGRIRFPEGDFLFEEHPFHWAVCLAAASIGFFNEVTCYHPVSNLDDAEGSAKEELRAFFTHFETIMALAAADDHDRQVAACKWLLDNMSWHMTSLQPEARYRYGEAAARTLQTIPAAVWSRIAERNADRQVWPVAVRLRRGDLDGQILQWQNQSLERALKGLDQRIRNLEALTEKSLTTMQGAEAAEGFASIKEIIASGGVATFPSPDSC